MPLIYQTHRPPELLAEIRALWRRIDRLDGNAIAAGGSGTRGPPGPPGEALSGTVHSWLQQVFFFKGSGEASPITNTYVVVPSIEGAYTHLDVTVVIFEVPELSTTQVTVRGNQPFQRLFQTTSDIHRAPYPVFYDHANIPYGRLDPNPEVFDAFKGVLADEPYGGDNSSQPTKGLAYIPIVPDSDHESIRLDLDFAWSTTTACFAGYFAGRYILHESNRFGTGICPGG